jgi:GNAT superfamily N-acetyltransferase
LEIKIAVSDADIAACFAVLSQLRPHLPQADFLATIRRLEATTGFRLASVTDDGRVRAVAGIRAAEWLYAGKYLEIEDLVTAEADRSRGYGGQLFDWLVQHARAQGCRQLRLVSGVAREAAHRFYGRKGMRFEAKYFSMDLG